MNMNIKVSEVKVMTKVEKIKYLVCEYAVKEIKYIGGK